MLTPEVHLSLSEVLRGNRTSDDARFILREQENGASLEAEFNSALRAVAHKIPGVTIDFDQLIAGDEIECDPLTAQGNLAILRLDTLYYQAFDAWKRSGGDLHIFKRMTKAENPATYSDRTEQHVRTDQNYPPDSQLLNQAVNITLSAFRIQATITHRRETLRNPDSNAHQVSRDRARSALPPRQTTSSETIDHAESLDDSLDSQGDIKPYDGKIALIRGVNKLGILKGYEKVDPLIKATEHRSPATSSDNDQASCPDSDRVPCSDGGTPQSEHADASNNGLPQPREKEFASRDTNKASLQTPFSAASASPREANSFTHNKPHVHKRE